MRWSTAVACLALSGSAGVAWAQTPTPAAIDLARQILREDGSFDALATGIAAKRIADVKTVQKLFGMTDARAALFVDKYWMPEMRARLQDFVDVGAEIYASRMSVADLKAVADFLQSSAGQKLITTRAEVGRELAAGGRGWQHAAMVDALKKFSADADAPNAH